MLEWLQEHRESLIWAGIFSLAAVLIFTPLAAVMLVRLPADYFKPVGQAREKRREIRHPTRKLILNTVGWIVLAIGIAMIFLPGPGLLVVLIGVMLADFPGKSKVQRWIISRQAVLKIANRLRTAFDKPPLSVSSQPA